jgi:UDP-N-acetylmuramate--alanine ligase
MDLKGPIHFIGIGGSGMSALAELAVKNGFKVQGSDTGSTATINKLTTLGINIFDKHRAENIGDAKTIVYSTAISESNVERQEAAAADLKILHRSDFLAFLMESKQSVTVAGTHGKTTTAAMITFLLDRLEVDPSAAIGGRMKHVGSSAKHGSGNLFVAEADESDGTFLKYKPYISVLTNVDSDHMEYFGSFENLEKQFSTYLSNTHEDGVAVVGWDNPASRAMGQKYTGNRLTYGFAIGSEVRAINYKLDKFETTFDAVVERDIVPIRLKMFGKHNVSNALCALAVIRSLELDVKKAAKALSDFPGVDRRLSLVFENADIRIYDDYAHNPGKIAACVTSLKEAFPRKKLHVVFQAHRYSRLETMYEETLGALEDADYIYVVPVFTAGETTEKDFSAQKLAKDLTIRCDTKSIACNNFKDAVESMSKHIIPPAIVLTIGAGDVWQVAHKIKEAYA